MAVVKGHSASVDFWTEQRAQEFHKRIEARTSVCFYCKGTGLGGPKPSETAAGSVECGGCDGTGKVNRLATIVDHMLEVGARESDIREWLGPLLEPERTLSVIRLGGRVNLEFRPAGPTVEGVVNRMDAEYNQEVVVEAGTSVTFRRVSGRNTMEVHLSISEQSFEARGEIERDPACTCPVNQGLTLRAPVDELCPMHGDEESVEAICICFYVTAGNRTLHADCPVHGIGPEGDEGDST